MKNRWWRAEASFIQLRTLKVLNGSFSFFAKIGVGFRLNLKLGFPIQSHFVSYSPSRPSSSSVRGGESSVNQTRLSYLSAIIEASEIMFRDPFKTYACTSSVQTLANEHSQMTVSKRSQCSLNYTIDDAEEPMEGSILVSPSRSRGRTSRFSLLLANLTILEESFADSDRLKLEKDILLQLRKLGALELFSTCLMRTLNTTNVFELFDVPTENIGKCKMKGKPNDHVNEFII